MKMLLSLLGILLLWGCSPKENPPSKVKNAEAIEVVSFKGLQVTGVTVSDKGRVFANFPRWREDIPFSVVEVNPDNGSYSPYPEKEVNAWNKDAKTTDSLFVAVQSVVAFEDKLYVLDTRNPFFKGLVDAPRIFVFDLNNNELIHIYTFDNQATKPNSYVNDLRVDKKHNRIYLTDSGEAGLIILDMLSGKSKRILDNHYSTLAEADHLLIDGKKWQHAVHSDGIALDTINDKLYFHSLTGYTLYSLDTKILDEDDAIIEDHVQLVAKTAAPDGMIMDEKGNLYFADLENHKIQFLSPGGKISTLIEGEKIKWADSFSIHDGYLFYTNSRIHEATENIENLTFSINKIQLK